MRFLVDECTGPTVARWLQAKGHEVFSIYEEARGIDDESIVGKAFAENWILITNDKGFGDRIYREQFPHKGVIFLRLADERTSNKIRVLERLLSDFSTRLPDQFVVVTETRVRFAKR
ncbi:MAG TPA: DUF5615 family PIN-like protein [Acidobacteriota bacterium]|nr:DUF5615 family PIN-like protein [Acidobacteriota bacterium]